MYTNKDVNTNICNLGCSEQSRRIHASNPTNLEETQTHFKAERKNADERQNHKSSSIRKRDKTNNTFLQKKVKFKHHQPRQINIYHRDVGLIHVII